MCQSRHVIRDWSGIRIDRNLIHLLIGGRRGATLCPGDSDNQDNTTDFLFETLPVIVA